MSLISPDFKEGKAILFIGMEGAGSKAKFYITDEAKEFLGTVRWPLAKPDFRAASSCDFSCQKCYHRYKEAINQTSA
jgi:hypothetical protein